MKSSPREPAERWFTATVQPCSLAFDATNEDRDSGNMCSVNREQFYLCVYLYYRTCNYQLPYSCAVNKTKVLKLPSINPRKLEVTSTCACLMQTVQYSKWEPPVSLECVVLACLTGALWAKRDERSILRKARDEVLLPSSCDSREMPRSPRLGHKAPVILASVGSILFSVNKQTCVELGARVTKTLYHT